MGIAPDFKSIFIKNWEINFSQCYPNSKVKLPELSNLLQVTASAHADSGGVGFADLAVNKQSWVLNRMRIEIDKLPIWSNNLEIKTWIEELKGFKSTRNFEISVEGEKYVGVSTLWAIFNMERRRPEAMAIDISHVECFPENHSTKLENRRVSPDFEELETYVGKVQFSDIDIVNHVNNTKYLEWCLNHIDPSLILDDKIKAIDLNFLKELSLGDDFMIEKGFEDNIIKFRVTKDDKVCFASYIELR